MAQNPYQSDTPQDKSVV